jgi:hypothetical protein
MNGARNMAARALAFVVCTLALTALARTAPADAPRRGEAAYLVMHSVLQSPRCLNCHPQGDVPLHGEEGASHAMHVSRSSVSAGLPCGSCHRSQNGNSAGSPPGAPDWRMPAAEMPLVFQSRTPRDLCAQLKDPARNGGRTGAGLIEHMAHDPLVAWAWHPGPGRSVPKESLESLIRVATLWVSEGMPCPP